MSRRRKKKRGHRLAKQKQAQLEGKRSTVITITDMAERKMKEGKEIFLKPAIPVAIRDMDSELKRAERATQYYLDRARDEGKPWFHCTKFPYKYSEDLIVDSEMAELALEYMEKNRRVGKQAMEGLVRDMLDGQFLSSHQSIGFNLHGRLYDGQHRMGAVIRAIELGAPPQMFYTTFNVPIESQFTTDIGRGRTDAQQLGRLNETKMEKVPSIIRAMMRGTSENLGFKPTVPELARFVEKYGETIAFVQKRLGTRKWRADVYAAVAKAMLWYGRELFADADFEVRMKAKDYRPTKFCDRFRTEAWDMDHYGLNDPAKILHSYLTKLKSKSAKPPKSQAEVYCKTLAAIEADLEGRELKKLAPKTVDFFPWLPGWLVPKDAPSEG